MSLLHFLYNNMYTIIVCHINHHTRGDENIKEKKLIESYCLNHNILFYTFDFKHNDNSNFHNAAREFRLFSYQNLILKHNLDGVILAHHLDDQIENILLYKNKISKKTMDEIAQINNIKVFRPLLNTYKDDIYLYAKKNNVKYLEDSSNQKDEYVRNNIRLNILKNFSKQKKSEILNKENERLTNLQRYDKADFLNNTFEQKQYYLNRFFYENKIYDVSTKIINQIINTYSLDGQKQFDVGNNNVLIITYGDFKLIKSKKNNNLQPKLIKKGYNIYNGIEFYNPYEDVFVRTRKPNDKIQYPTFSKKVTRIMIDEKIPKYLRHDWPIITDKNDNALAVAKRRIMNNSTKYLKEILVSEQEIKEICSTMGKEITNAYQNTEKPVIFLGLLKGCHPFMSDLLKEIDLTLEIDYMDVSSFFGGTKSAGEVQIVKDMSASVEGRDVVIVEDIVDSGRTIKKVSELLEFRGAKSVEVATLIDKPEGRTVDLEAKFVGTTVPKAFIIGYGLDYNEYYRNLKDIGIPHDELIKE